MVYLSNGGYRINEAIVTNNFKKKKNVKIKLLIRNYDTMEDSEKITDFHDSNKKKFEK